jgi:hypothetical protein
MTVQSNITPDDWRAFVRFTQQRVRGGVAEKLKRWLVVLGVGVAFGLVMALTNIPIDPLSLLVGVLATVSWLLILSRLQMRRTMPAADGIILGPHSITLDEDGVRDCGRLRESLVRWEAVRGAQLTSAHVFIVVDNHAAFIVPRNAFSSDAEREQFVGEIQKSSGKPAT